MARNNKFEAIINQIQIDNKGELKEMSLLEYAKMNLDANRYWFFTADTDDTNEQLNNDFIAYIEKNYNA